MSEPTMDNKFLSRLHSGLDTIMQWESDKSLLKEIRDSIPLKELMSSSLNKLYHRKDDEDYNGDDLLLKRLTLYFQKSMKWMNAPNCKHCGFDKTANVGARGPESVDEIRGRASRVEVYNCPQCNGVTEFPRYNSARAILNSKTGRCGEYANLFGMYCLAVGFDQVRYVLDSTDHVWVEVYSLQSRRYIMADGCEGLIDKNSMYEKGWGKKLQYIIAFSLVEHNTTDTVQIVDVTQRYTRQLTSHQMQSRRRQTVSSELKGEMMIAQLNSYKRHTANNTNNGNTYIAKRCTQILNREQDELTYFAKCHSTSSWGTDHDQFVTGRVSGDLFWKSARNELGLGLELAPPTSASSVSSNQYESANNTSTATPTALNTNTNTFFLPNLSNRLCITATPNITLNHYAITLCGNDNNDNIPCAIGTSGYNLIVIDQRNGCLLQSIVCTTHTQLIHFISGIPTGRIIAFALILPSDDKDESDSIGVLSDYDIQHLHPLKNHLGGINIPSTNNNSQTTLSAFIGQIGYHPTWTTSIIITDNISSSSLQQQSFPQINIKILLQDKCKSNLKLHTTSNYSTTIPSCISCRIPNHIATLEQQLQMTFEQKKLLFFHTFVATSSRTSQQHYIGFITKPDAPIYLFTSMAFPWNCCLSLKQHNQNNFNMRNNSNFDKVDSWSTCHVLPEELVPKEKEIEEEEQSYNVHVPVNFDYFTSLFGNTILQTTNSTTTIQEALTSTRLVALYFSAHWCPPCKKFTPLLTEFYNTIQSIDEFQHALEIIFISSDRDESSFNSYYNTMPWLALPYSTTSNPFIKEMLSTNFSIRGIPALIILDTISGEVVSMNAREDVMKVCQRGSKLEQLLDTWLASIPEESQMIMQTLELSVQHYEPSEEVHNNEFNEQIQSFLFKSHHSNDDEKPKAVVNNNKSSLTSTTSTNTADRVKAIFTQSVASGDDPSQAAADAIQQVAKEDSDAAAAEKEKQKLLFLDSTTITTSDFDQQPTIPLSYCTTISYPCLSYNTEDMNKHKKKTSNDNIILFNTTKTNDSQECYSDDKNEMLLQGLRLYRHKETNVIIGFQCLYNNTTGSIQKYNCTNDSNDDCCNSWSLAPIVNDVDNNTAVVKHEKDDIIPSIIRIDGIWNENDGVIQDLTLVIKTTTNNNINKMPSQYHYTSSSSSSLSKNRFSLHVPTTNYGEEVLIGLHGIFSSNGITSLGLVCKREDLEININSSSLFEDSISIPNVPLQISYEAMKVYSQTNDQKKSIMMQSILSTALKYIQNTIKNPHYSKFRHFKITNKVLDKYIGSIFGGIDFICSIGFEIMIPIIEEEDIAINIPLAADLMEMKRILDCLINYFDSKED